MAPVPAACAVRESSGKREQAGRAGRRACATARDAAAGYLGTVLFLLARGWRLSRGSLHASIRSATRGKTLRVAVEALRAKNTTRARILHFRAAPSHGVAGAMCWAARSGTLLKC
jgi:hypothetical protein